MKTYKTVLSIAGSDSCGGAGIQADIKTCCAFGVYAMTVITAVTAQNTCGVSRVEACSPQMLRAQLWSVLEDIRPDAVKIGMVPSGETVSIIAEAIETFHLKNVVVDTVISSTSGHTLSGDGYTDMLINKLIPLSSIITPNLPEAEILTGKHVNDKDSMCELASEMCREYGVAVLLKGGHLTKTNVLTDFFADTDGAIIEFPHPLVNTKNTHGTGCSLSSAIAAQLACGYCLKDAVRNADIWLHRAIEAGAEYTIGHGNGPINHLFNIINHEDNSKQ